MLDEKLNAKLYEDCPAATFLVEGYHVQTILSRVGGKLVRTQDYDEDHLTSLAERICRCAESGGDWSGLVSESKK